MKNLLPLLALAALTSCSITKREYMPGYDVQWHNKKEAVTTGVPKQRSENEQKQTPEVASVNEVKPLMKKFAFPNLLLAGDTIITKKGDTIFCKITKETSMNIWYTENKVGKSIPKTDVATTKKDVNEAVLVKPIEKKPVNPDKWAMIGMLLGALSLLSFIISPAFISAGFLFPTIGPGFFVAIVIGAISSIVGFIFSTSALKIMKREPDRYKRQEMAKTGSILNGIPVFLLTILFLGLIFSMLTSM